MIIGNPEKAREFFATKLTCTAGPIEVKDMLDRGEDCVIIDVRQPEVYAKSRIPGAVNLPRGQWHTANGASKDRLNILYCYSPTCHLAAAAALELALQGYRVLEMEGGFTAWTASGLPTAGNDDADAARLGTARAGGR